MDYKHQINMLYYISGIASKDGYTELSEFFIDVRKSIEKLASENKELKNQNDELAWKCNQVRCENYNLKAQPSRKELNNLKKYVEILEAMITGHKEIKVKLDPGAYLPEYAHDADAGMDLRSPRDVYIMPNSSRTIDTGVHIAIPPGMVGMLKSKSGLNVKHGLLNTGVIDSGYTGSIVVKLYNHTYSAYFVKQGDKISQLVILPVIHAQLELVDELEETERGENGFGSTGK